MGSLAQDEEAQAPPASASTIKVAVSQHEPAWLDLQASVAKVCSIISEAARNGAGLVAFPECFIPAYPMWIWTRPVDPALTAQYIKNSLVIDSPEMKRIQASAQENHIAVLLGFSENDNNSLYIAQALIDSDGSILMKRRKLKATHMERTLFGDAYDSCLDNVATLSESGIRTGALACWEHAQPLLKYSTIQQKEQLHIASWPPLEPHAGALWSLSREGCQSLSQTYAIESQAFVLHSTALITQRGIDAMGTAGGMIMATPGGGASAVFGPDGRMLTEPLGAMEEGLVYAEVDLDASLVPRSFLDVCGHYSRPDLLWLGRKGHNRVTLDLRTGKEDA